MMMETDKIAEARAIAKLEVIKGLSSVNESSWTVIDVIEEYLNATGHSELSQILVEVDNKSL